MLFQNVQHIVFFINKLGFINGIHHFWPQIRILHVQLYMLTSGEVWNPRSSLKYVCFYLYIYMYSGILNLSLLIRGAINTVTRFRHISDTFPTHFRHISDTFPIVVLYCSYMFPICFLYVSYIFPRLPY